jgi:predicted RNase H-like nuclease
MEDIKVALAIGDRAGWYSTHIGKHSNAILAVSLKMMPIFSSLATTLELSGL